MILAAGRDERCAATTAAKPISKRVASTRVGHRRPSAGGTPSRQTFASRAHRESARRRPALDARNTLFVRAEALETAGGYAKALRCSAHAPFVAVNGDIHTDFDF